MFVIILFALRILFLKFGVECLFRFLQTEFRKTLFWRLAGNIFFEGGKTGEYFSDLMRNKWHTGLGFGGQFALNMSEKLYARADFSWIDFEQLGITFYIREAF